MGIGKCSGEQYPPAACSCYISNAGTLPALNYHSRHQSSYYFIGTASLYRAILGRFGLENTRTAVTPMEVGFDLNPGSPHLSATLLTPAQKTKYREMIGCLMYATVMTRPDIAFAVSTLSQYLDTPHSTHIQAVTRIFRYLSATRELKLVLGGSHITGYSDRRFIATPFLGLLSLLASTPSLGAQRNNPSSLFPVPRLSMLLSPTLQGYYLDS